MKKVLFILIIFSLIACNQETKETQESNQGQEAKTLQENAILTYIRENAHNPSSYKPLETTLVDSIKNTHFLQKEVDFLAQSVQTDKEYKLSRNLAKDEREYKLKKHSLDSLISKEGVYITHYVYKHKFRIHVPMGGEMLKIRMFVFDKSGKIVESREEK
jgi:hypothetical protein